MSCVWRLCHPVAELRASIIGKAYQDLRRRHSSEGNAEGCAEGKGGLKIVVARSMLMHHELSDSTARVR